MNSTIRKTILIGAIWLLAASGALAEGRYCIVKVSDGLIGREYHQVRGLPPVFTPLNFDGSRWTISQDRRVVRYEGLYPTSYLDRNHRNDSFAFDDYWKVEPWSGRTVASSNAPSVISVIEPGSKSFKQVGDRGHFSSPFVLPRTKETIVINNGRAFSVDENSLTPWEPASRLSMAGAPGLIGVYDAPSLLSLIALDTNHTLWALPDGGEWQRLISLDKASFGRVFDSSMAKAAIFVSPKSVTRITKSMAGNSAEFTAETLSQTSANGADRNFVYLTRLGEILAYSHGKLADFVARPKFSSLRKSWRRLTSDGFEAIPSGDNAEASPAEAAGWRTKDIASLQLVLIQGSGGLFIYDGQRVTPVIGGEREKIGPYPIVYDMPAIGRAFVKTSRGLKELKSEELIDVPDSLPASPLAMSDWPQSRRATLFTTDKIYVIDRDLKISGTLDISAIGFDSAISGGTNPVTGDMIFTGKQATYLVVDISQNGQSTCETRTE